MMYLATTAGQSPGLMDYFWQSNFAGQVIVLALVVFSLAAWSLMLGKYFELNRWKRQNEAYEGKLNEGGSVMRAIVSRGGEVEGPYAKMAEEVKRAYELGVSQQSGGGKSLIMGHIENALQRSVSHLSVMYEANMIILGSILSGAPFLGLLGTVWGVMDSFGEVAMKSNATIQSLAPGVSGALLTTVAALLVAIPSVFGYNYLLARIKRMILELESFASVVADRIELEMEE